jgi:Tol biopolymer transport system component
MAMDAQGHDVPLAFSPDAKRLLFLRMGPRDGFGDLYVIDAAGGDARRLNPDGITVPSSELFGPGGSWSSDGLRVAFAGHSGDDGLSRIYVADVASGDAAVPITLPGFWSMSARWSPAQDRIVFDRDGVDGHDLIVINADGSGETDVTGDLEAPCCATWSPEGTSLLVMAGGEDEQHADLWIIGADGTGARRLTDEPAEYSSYAWVAGQ